MYKVTYSKFSKMWMVQAPSGLAQSSWSDRRDAINTASSLNRSSYDRPRK